jgi:hypothetical protein
MELVLNFMVYSISLACEYRSIPFHGSILMSISIFPVYPLGAR